MPNSSPKATRTAGAVCTTTFLVGSLMAAITFLMLSTNVRAPTGHTCTHWPQLTHELSPSFCSKAGATTDGKPRFTPLRAPTVWNLLHIVSQRRQ